MKERPVLFSGPMVKAILDGRKTQTRRVIKARSKFDDIADAIAIHPDGSGKGWIAWLGAKAHSPEDTARLYPGEDGFKCPYGQPGDRLWVRESFWDCGSKDGIYYHADSNLKPDWGFKLRPSIHMPRWASRITLEVTKVRVERLQDIRDTGPKNDCTAEGIFHCGMPVPLYEEWYYEGWTSSEKLMYKKLWESINGPGSWDANPWVWVVEFRRIV